MAKTPFTIEFESAMPFNNKISTTKQTQNEKCYIAILNLKMHCIFNQQEVQYQNFQSHLGTKPHVVINKLWTNQGKQSTFSDLIYGIHYEVYNCDIFGIPKT